MCRSWLTPVYERRRSHFRNFLSLVLLINYSGSIYIMEIGKCYKLGLPLPFQRISYSTFSSTPPGYPTLDPCRLDFFPDGLEQVE